MSSQNIVKALGDLGLRYSESSDGSYQVYYSKSQNNVESLIKKIFSALPDPLMVVYKTPAQSTQWWYRENKKIKSLDSKNIELDEFGANQGKLSEIYKTQNPKVLVLQVDSEK